MILSFSLCADCRENLYKDRKECLTIHSDLSSTILINLCKDCSQRNTRQKTLSDRKVELDKNDQTPKKFKSKQVGYNGFTFKNDEEEDDDDLTCDCIDIHCKNNNNPPPYAPNAPPAQNQIHNGYAYQQKLDDATPEFARHPYSYMPQPPPAPQANRNRSSVFYPIR